jgi:HEAT repeat protein
MLQTDKNNSAATSLRRALHATAPAARLQAALTAGTRPDPSNIEVLVETCRTEPDFYVRDMLTWALIRHEPQLVVEAVVPELTSETAQARSQALHTLSKIGDPETWPAITTDLLHDSDDEVARTAWRTAARLVPDGEEAGLANELVSEFARGGRDMQLSLSRAFANLGPAAEPVIDRLKNHPIEEIRTHAIATERIMADPGEGFDTAVQEARRTVALLAVPGIEEETDADW